MPISAMEPAGSDASQNGSYSGLVTPRLHKMREQDAGELSFVRRARPRPNGVDWRLLSAGGTPYRIRRVATTWEPPGRVCVRRDRGGPRYPDNWTAPRASRRPPAPPL